MNDKRYEYEITADVAQFRRAMDDAAQSSRDSARQVGDAFRNASGGIAPLTSALGGLKSVLAGAFSVGAVVQFGRSVAASTLEAEQSTALLNATLRATGYAAGLSAGDIEGLVSELQKVSQFDDDPLRQGVTALLRFREISGETFKDASRLAVDLAVATGKDLPESFTAIGKALQDPIAGTKGLRDAGFKLSEGQLELAKTLRDTNDVMGSQKIVLDELASSIGGVGATASQGLTGATRSLANAWDDLLKNIGRLPAVAGSTRSTLDALTLSIAALNRMVATPDSPLKGGIAVPGVPTAAAKIGQLSEADALALQNAGGRRVTIAEPKPRDKEAEAVAKRLASERKRLADEAYREQLAFNKAASDDEIRNLERVADERQRIEDDANEERIKALQAAPLEAERQAKERADRLSGLLGDTKTGQRAKLAEDLALLNAAFDKGAISAQQLDEAYANLRERANDIDGLKKIADDADKQSEAFRQLESAIKGWGNAFNEELVQGLKSGQLEFSRLIDMIITDIARLVVYRNITQPLFSALGGMFPGSGTPPGGGSSPSGTPFGYNFGGQRAAGGDVLGGSWYLVGERGPEKLYVPPGSSGSIVPGGRSGAVIQQTVYVDARSDIGSVRAAVYEAAQLAQSESARNDRRG